MEVQSDDNYKYAPIQFTVSVSKRCFKRAVDRNRVKRLIRENYRLQKNPLIEKITAQDRNFAWMLLYTGKELPTYQQINKSLRKIINTFTVKELNLNDENHS